MACCCVYGWLVVVQTQPSANCFENSLAGQYAPCVHTTAQLAASYAPLNMHAHACPKVLLCTFARRVSTYGMQCAGLHGATLQLVGLEGLSRMQVMESRVVECCGSAQHCADCLTVCVGPAGSHIQVRMHGTVVQAATQLCGDMYNTLACEAALLVMGSHRTCGAPGLLHAVCM